MICRLRVYTVYFDWCIQLNTYKIVIVNFTIVLILPYKAYYPYKMATATIVYRE